MVKQTQLTIKEQIGLFVYLWLSLMPVKKITNVFKHKQGIKNMPKHHAFRKSSCQLTIHKKVKRNKLNRSSKVADRRVSRKIKTSKAKKQCL